MGGRLVRRRSLRSFDEVTDDMRTLRLFLLASAALATVAPLGAPAYAAALPTRPTIDATSRPLTTPAALASENTARLSSARIALSRKGPTTIAVVGDSVGNDPGEWVSMWAGGLATDRYAMVRHFDWARPGYRKDVEVHAPSSDLAAREPVTIWNFGWPGGTPQRALDHLVTGVPARPDLVVVSFGHNVAPGTVEPQYTALLAGIRKRFGAVPVVVTAAHMTPTARAGQAEGRARLLRWARAQRLPVVDLRGAFDGLRDPRSAMFDAVHPNVLGYRLITEAVEAAFGTRTPAACTRDGATVKVGPGLVNRYGARAQAYRANVTVTDGCGRRLPHAWVSARVEGTSRSVVSTQTTAGGVAALEIVVPNRSTQTVTLSVDDGTTTGAAAPFHLRVP